MTVPSWKDHPVIVLATAFGAGFAFALTVALPLYNTFAQNRYDEKLRQVEEQYAHDKADIQNMKGLRKDNLFFRTQLAQARTELWQLADKKPFRPNSPIPVGFEAVQAGMKIDDLKALFPDATHTESVGYLFLHLKGGLIEELQIKLAKDRVGSVTYYSGDDLNSKERLMGAVMAAFGQPTSRSTNDDGDTLFHWKVGDKQVTVFGHQYSVDDLT